jgi:hypothetical protein
MKSIADKVHEALTREDREIGAGEVLKRFFMIDTNNEEFAEQIVSGVLLKDPRFRRTVRGTWEAVKVRTLSELPLSETPFVLFQIDNAEDFIRGTRLGGFGPGPETAGADAAGPADYSPEDYSPYAFLLYRGDTGTAEANPGDLLEDPWRFVFVPYEQKSLAALKKIFLACTPLPVELTTLSVRNVLSALYPGLVMKTWDDIVRGLDIRNVEPTGPRSKVKNLLLCFERILREAENGKIRTAGDLIATGVRPRKEVDFSRYAFSAEWVGGLPQCPGVYTFLDSEQQVIYVGKTNNLRARINSYFWNTGESPEKIENILRDMYDIDCTGLSSELEALIEEQRLIDRHRPRYNTQIGVSERKADIPRYILIPKTAAKGSVKLYLISPGLPLIEHEYWCGGEDRRLQAAIDEMTAASGYVHDPLKQIALSYLERYERNLVVVDVDRYASARDVERVLKHHCNDLMQGEWHAFERSIYL